MKRWHGLVALAFGATVVGGGVVSAEATLPTNNERSPGILASARSEAARLASFVELEDDEPVASGTLDDGKELLPKATITLEEAVAAAQASASGEVGDVDLEYYQGKLVFNVDVGNQDVKVDAATGDVLGAETDD
jgi:uncharacterized membrane protein YkoI